MQSAQKIQYKKDDILETTIEDIGSDGEGIGKVDGFTLFIKDAVIGDTVTCKIMKVQKNYAFAKLLEVIKPSPFRVAPRCEMARKCGGCQIQELEYGRQLTFKEDKVRNILIRIGGFDKEEVDNVMLPIVGMEDPFRYRNKAQVPVGTDKDNSPVAGFYAGRTHVIVPVSECYIGAEDNQKIIATVIGWMRDNNVKPYDEKTGSGAVRHILIRSGLYSKEVMVCIIANCDKLPHEDKLIEALSVLPNMTSITLNTNTLKTNVIMGKKMRLLWGNDCIQDSLHVFNVSEKKKDDGREHAVFTPAGRQVMFRISPRSFYQVNPAQTEKLYSIVRKYAGLKGTERVWDLYCGVGTISLFLAADVKEVYGVEVIPEAIEDAKKNADLNGITNATFCVGKVEDVLPEYVERMKRIGGKSDIVDVVIVDPPRKGCDAKCLETILSVRPEKIVYVSCDPATLARDLKILSEGGYKLKHVQPVDQFGHTVHVECVVALHRVGM